MPTDTPAAGLYEQHELFTGIGVRGREAFCNILITAQSRFNI